MGDSFEKRARERRKQQKRREKAQRKRERDVDKPPEGEQREVTQYDWFVEAGDEPTPPERLEPEEAP